MVALLTHRQAAASTAACRSTSCCRRAPFRYPSPPIGTDRDGWPITESRVLPHVARLHTVSVPVVLDGNRRTEPLAGHPPRRFGDEPVQACALADQGSLLRSRFEAVEAAAVTSLTGDPVGALAIMDGMPLNEVPRAVQEIVIRLRVTMLGLAGRADRPRRHQSRRAPQQEKRRGDRPRQGETARDDLSDVREPHVAPAPPSAPGRPAPR
jgi:hypothetical protein